MTIIIILIVISLCVATCFLIAFVWAVRSGQYDDSHTPGMRMLLDEKPSDLNK